MTYIPPEFQKNAFHCPRCGVFAHQNWSQLLFFYPSGQREDVAGLNVSRCTHCTEFSIWLQHQMLSPEISSAPLPHPDIPEKVKADYDEARHVFSASPRSSAALLRLAIQKLCIELGQPGKNLNLDIGKLVEAGLPIQVQRSLDIVRVVGNNQVHPGVIDVRDNPSIAAMLFELVNLIVEDRITRPKQIDALYQKLPEAARKQIEERDAKPIKTGGAT